MNLIANRSDRSGPQQLISLTLGNTPKWGSLPRWRRRILILGVGSLAQELLQIFLSRRKMFSDVVGLLAKDNAQFESGGKNILGTLEQLVEVVERHRIDTIAV